MLLYLHVYKNTHAENLSAYVLCRSLAEFDMVTDVIIRPYDCFYLTSTSVPWQYYLGREWSLSIDLYSRLETLTSSISFGQGISKLLLSYGKPY